MELSQYQIKLIKQSWRNFRDVSPAVVGDLFYSKLFSDHPSLRKMFPKKMDEQYKKLIDTLTTIVVRLDNLDTINDEITEMARRHVDYGVKPVHYKIVGDALLWTLKKGTGCDWNNETEEAWLSCYTILSNLMINVTAQKETL